MMIPPVTLSQLLYFPNDRSYPLALRGKKIITHGEFFTKLSVLVSILNNRTEQKWLLYCEDSVEFAIALLALLCAGKNSVVAPNGQPGTLALLSSRCDALLLERNLGELIANSPRATPAVIDANTLLAERSTITMATSGSSGAMKWVEKPLHTFLAEIAVLEQLWGVTVADAHVFSTVSHQHIYGMLFRLLWPLSRGRLLVAETYAYPEPLFLAMSHVDRAVLISSPAHLKRIPAAIAGEPVRHRLGAVFSSGGPLATQDATDFYVRFGKAPIEIFGSTETGGVAFREQDGSDAGKAWQVLPGVNTKIDAVSDCLSIQSPYAFQSDWCEMGDKVKWLDAHHFVHEGRADRIVKLEEKRLSLTAMEEHLKQHPLVEDSRIILLETGGVRQQLGAVVILVDHSFPEDENARRALSQKLRDHLLSFFERSLLPRKWRYVKVVPCNSQGKVTQDSLQALFAAPANHGSDISRLVELREQSDLVIRARIDMALHPGFFDGHFPEMPILPGVVQLHWVIELAKHFWYPNHRFGGTPRIKFQRPIQPQDVLDIEMDNKGEGKVSYRYSVGGTDLSSGTVIFYPDHQ